MAVAALLIASSAASQQPDARDSGGKGGQSETERPASSDTVRRYIEYAEREAERHRRACEAAIADYQTRCPIRGSNPNFQTERCADYQNHIRSRCFQEGNR